jgi:hypothetical protein
LDCMTARQESNPNTLKQVFIFDLLYYLCTSYQNIE